MERWRFRASCLTYPFTLARSDWVKLIKRKLSRHRASVPSVKRYVYADSLHRANSLAHRQASQDFVPRRYPGTVTLFRAREQDQHTRRIQHYFGGPDMGWKRTATAVEVHWMPDFHREMMHGVNAPGFAQALQACLDQARAADTSRVGTMEPRLAPVLDTATR